MKWPLLGAWSANTLDSQRRIAERHALELLGTPWPELMARLRERVDEEEELGE